MHFVYLSNRDKNKPRQGKVQMNTCEPDILKYKLIMQMLSSVPMPIDLFDLKPTLSGLLGFFIVITARKLSLGKVMF